MEAFWVILGQTHHLKRVAVRTIRRRGEGSQQLWGERRDTSKINKQMDRLAHYFITISSWLTTSQVIYFVMLFCLYQSLRQVEGSRAHAWWFLLALANRVNTQLVLHSESFLLFSFVKMGTLKTQNYKNTQGNNPPGLLMEYIFINSMEINNCSF